MTSPKSISAFCTKFLNGEEQRLDGIVFGHEYTLYGGLSRSSKPEELENARKEGSLATFLAITLLLPALLVAPVERDIRIVNICNPFYAAAIPTFTPSVETPSSSTQSTFVAEGARALRTIIFTRHVSQALSSYAQLLTSSLAPTHPRRSSVFRPSTHNRLIHNRHPSRSWQIPEEQYCMRKRMPRNESAGHSRSSPWILRTVITFTSVTYVSCLLSPLHTFNADTV